MYLTPLAPGLACASAASASLPRPHCTYSATHMHSTTERKKKKAASDHVLYHEKGGQEKALQRAHFKYHNKGGQQRAAALYVDKLKPDREAETRARNLRHGLPENVSTPNLHQMQYWW